jgi:CMP-N-acetylneuraminic acid synthetase
MAKISALIPARGGSERVVNKNIRPFAGYQSGLLELKLLQLSRVNALSEVIVSTNDEEIIECAQRFKHDLDKRIQIIRRPSELATSSTPMSDFIRYCADLRHEGVMLMTHVTHPFVSSSVIDGLVKAWHTAEKNGHDSLVTVTRIHKFLWNNAGPYNYDNRVEKWPRSQDLKPLFEINHAAYIIPFRVMRQQEDRIGSSPYLQEMPESVAMDIDWEDQFSLFEDVALGRMSRGLSLL